MTYSKIGGVEILLSTIQKQTDVSQIARIGHIRVYFQMLTNPGLGSYGLKSAILRIDSLSATFATGIRERIGLEIQRILEDHVANWLLIWGHQVYNVLDMVNSARYDSKSPYLRLFDQEWLLARKERFLSAAKGWYAAALRANDVAVMEKIEYFFPELGMAKVPYMIQYSYRKTMP